MALPHEKREPLAGLSCEGSSLGGDPKCELGLAAGKSDDDVGEDVLDLLAHRKKDDDDHDGNEYQDQGVLHHTLAFLAGRKATQLPDKVGHFFSHLPFLVIRFTSENGPRPRLLLRRRGWPMAIRP